ncbi:phosphatidylinositol mannoside acyltransferase [Trueperella bialowiezensis]|uniref:Phosphatidylinositol mannoside acyltransferase n=1 Tax=Trueperella bialowiezensis TaxID=312285 RepID=A0A3S4X4H6_9ACTO|nr:phosphatidylinositol mannoside acyltransferase [Trueperella bialowiezensis]VEI12488.1 Phosphatidylinositol mannoside acyltransferase [Trueperella bialowiezensis]
MNILSIFRGAIWLVKVLPESVGRAFFRAIGTLAGVSNMKGAAQLRKNYQRIEPLESPWAQRLRSAKAMRSYMDYYYEAFRLPALTAEQIEARVELVNGEKLVAHMNSGRSASGALLHMGNWDLAGAWACAHLAPTYSIAEKLQPPELADLFLDFRRSLGLTIYQTGQKGTISALTQDMKAGHAFVPLLVDRDLSASGVEVKMAGHPVRVAVGSAVLAQHTGEPMFPVTITTSDFGDDAARVKRAGTRYGIKLIVGEPIYSAVEPDAPAPQRQADIIRMNQEWLDQIEPLLREHLTDWHMLQKVFVADLDPERLARARRKEEQ